MTADRIPLRPHRKASARHTVYFVQAVNGGLIKIGIAQDPQQRLAAMQAGCPIQLRIIALIGDSNWFDEQRLHRLFEADRRHGEWFEPSARLLDYIFEHATDMPSDVADDILREALGWHIGADDLLEPEPAEAVGQ